MKRKLFILWWRGYSGRLHRLDTPAFYYNDRWCITGKAGTIQGLPPAINDCVEKANPCRKKKSNALHLATR
jgi:hypothetical protein